MRLELADALADGIDESMRPRVLRQGVLSLALSLAATVPCLAATSDPWVDVTDPKLQVPGQVRPLFDTWIRDTYVMLGPDGYYYLTGSTAWPGTTHCWDTNDGLHLWRSRDLKQWDHMGLVWSLDRDATWQRKPAMMKPGQVSPTNDVLGPERRALWAPEIHYIKSKKAWVVVACMNGPGRGSFILRSTSGRPEGPYENIPGNADGPIHNRIDGSLFEDDDGTVYFVGHNHFIARMKDDLSGLAEPIQQLKETPYEPEPYAEGVTIVKHAGLYHLIQTYWSFKKEDGRYSRLGPSTNHPSRHSYDVVIATSKDIRGPYGPRYTAIVEGGHNNFFRDKSGQWWSTLFGNPRGSSAKTAAFLCRPAIVPIKYSDGRFHPDPTRVLTK